MSFSLTREGSDTTPRRFYPNYLEARGLHPTGALARTLWQNDSDEIEKHPLGGSIRITWRLGGYCRGPNTRVPQKVEPITIER